MNWRNGSPLGKQSRVELSAVRQHPVSVRAVSLLVRWLLLQFTDESLLCDLPDRGMHLVALREDKPPILITNLSDHHSVNLTETVTV